MNKKLFFAFIPAILILAGAFTMATPSRKSASDPIFLYTIFETNPNNMNTVVQSSTVSIQSTDLLTATGVINAYVASLQQAYTCPIVTNGTNGTCIPSGTIVSSTLLAQVTI